MARERPPPLSKGIVKTRAIIYKDIEAHRDGKDGEGDSEGQIIGAAHALCRVPAAAFLFGEAAQIHGVGNGVNAIHGREYEGDDGKRGVFKAFEQWRFFADFEPAGLLCSGDGAIVVDEIGK